MAGHLESEPHEVQGHQLLLFAALYMSYTRTTWHQLLTVRSALSKRADPEKDPGTGQVVVCRREAPPPLAGWTCGAMLGLRPETGARPPALTLLPRPRRPTAPADTAASPHCRIFEAGFPFSFKNAQKSVWNLEF